MRAYLQGQLSSLLVLEELQEQSLQGMARTLWIVPVLFGMPLLLGMPIWQPAICVSPGVQQFCHLITASSDPCQAMHHI